MNQQEFWNQIVKTANCWYWTGGTNNRNYGSLRLDGKRYLAHRLAYELYKGAIPTDMEINHICNNRLCVNPNHLELVTHKENMEKGFWATKTHCINGHLLAGNNLYLDPRGKRGYQTCRNQSRFEYRERMQIGNRA